MTDFRHFLHVATALVCACALVHAADAKRPNVIFILCDDLGYGDLGVFFQNGGAGNRKPRVPMDATPQIDALAEQGVQLRGHYTAAPVCAPARASLLSGLHQGHANVRDNQFDKALADNHTLGSVMRQAGYRTACIGKWGLQGGKAQPGHPLARGFDEYFGYIAHRDGHLHYPKEDKVPLLDGREEVSADFDKCYTTDLFTARAKKFIIDQQRDHAEQPFFLYLAYDTPHARTQLPPTAYPEGRGVSGGIQWLGNKGEMINTARGEVDSYYYPEFKDAVWKDPDMGGREQPWPEVARRHASMLRRIDDCVGDLAATLRDLKIDRDTLVVFTTDNGPSEESYLQGKDAAGYPRRLNPGFLRSYGPFEGIKRDCYEGGIRVGAVVSWPGHAVSGEISERASQFHDWMPTLCEIAGVPAPALSDGVSLLPEITGKGKRPDSTLYVEYQVGGNTPDNTDFAPSRRKQQRGQMQVLRQGDRVGVRTHIQSADDDFQIYDVVKDPGQRHDLAPEMKALQQTFKDRAIQLHRPDASAPRPYLDALAVPAAAPDGPTQAGLSARVYQVTVPWAIDDSHLSPAASDIVPVAEWSASDKGNAVVMDGWLKVDGPGVYRFALPLSSRGVMKLHGSPVVDADRGGKPEGEIRLAAGLHPIRISFRCAEQPFALTWSKDGGEIATVPAAAFVTRR